MQRIPDELAGHLDAAAGPGESRQTALVVGPFSRLWCVEVARDSDGAFLGRGWPEFAGAHRAGAGWFVVLRRHGGGVLAVKAFDASCCLKEYGAPAAGKYLCANIWTVKQNLFTCVIETVPSKFF